MRGNAEGGRDDDQILYYVLPLKCRNEEARPCLACQKEEGHACCKHVNEKKRHHFALVASYQEHDADEHLEQAE